MQSKLEMQGRLLPLGLLRRSSLSPAERAVRDWAMVDDQQAVLEVFGQEGNLLRHYLDHYRLRACGLCFNEHQTRALRLSIDCAEVMPSVGSDIPWQDRSFDRILIARPLPAYLDLAAFFQECHRVLRPGGRLVIALSTLPLRGQSSSLGGMGRQQLLKAFEACGFCDVSYRRSRLSYLSIIARKADA